MITLPGKFHFWRAASTVGMDILHFIIIGKTREESKKATHQ
jgi:hypothetical protein